MVHGWPPQHVAGTELYAHGLAHAQAQHREVAVYTRVADPESSLGSATEEMDGDVRVRRVVNNFLQRSPLSRNALRSAVLERDFDAFLERFRPSLVHVHHLAGHCLGLLGRIARRRLPLVYQIQDWWALCARASLCHPRLSAGGAICPGPSPARCSDCLAQTRLPGATLWNPLLYLYRSRLAKAGLRAADAFVMGSRAIEADYRSAGLLRPEDPVHVIPYGVKLPQAKAPRSATPRLPLRFGFVGSVQYHKGVHVAAEALAGLARDRAVFNVWGDATIDPAYNERLLGCPVLSLRGTFREQDKDRVFAEMDVLLVPSLGLESFGLVAREAMARDVPVIASRRGALRELFPEEGAGGTWFEPGDASGLRDLVERLLASPELVTEWRRRSPPVIGAEEHAGLIEGVYVEVLAASAR